MSPNEWNTLFSIIFVVLLLALFYNLSQHSKYKKDLAEDRAKPYFLSGIMPSENAVKQTRKQIWIVIINLIIIGLYLYAKGGEA